MDRFWLMAALAAFALPAGAAPLIIEATALPQANPVHMQDISARAPLKISAVSDDGLCTIDLEFVHLETGSGDEDASLSGRVAMALCGEHRIESGFANANFRRADDGSVQLDGKLEVVLLVNDDDAAPAPAGAGR